MKHDLAYYLDHPDEMPVNFHELGTENDGEEKEVSPEAEIGEVKGSVQPPAEKEVEAKPGEAAKKEEQPSALQVVKSKDGKHEIPYAVLQAERDARKAADQAVAQLTERLTALEQAAKTGSTKDVEKAAEAEPDLSEEEVNQIAEDFPAVAKLLKGLTSKIGQLEKQVSETASREQARGAKEQDSASKTVQQAIDANPTIRFWQMKDPDSFQRAVEFDNQIKADKRNADLSLDERFSKVVAAMEAVYGPTDLPPEFQVAPAASKVVKDDKSAKDVKAKAEKAVADAEKEGKEVKSLSDIPGGTPPESDEISQLGQLSPHELANKFDKMTAAQQNAILARLL